ncbi:MAG: SgcJ/EcaC family oxidoreductase [Solirubrobacterales bacterium]|nr:SgcJ/EcaC family oxidoreductase [Solirubrobacterales bacterium]
MNDDELEIRELIDGWLRAIRAHDLEGVVAGHSDDIVMFDVPPPEDGARGIDAYSATWPPFLEWLASGAVFDAVAVEVFAGGGDFAYAHALLRCGTPERLAAEPDRRLRLTLGLRREDGRWLVAHEHHSFTAQG